MLADTSRHVVGGAVVDQELLTTVAVTLATKTAEGLAAGGKAAFEALVRLVRRKFHDPESSGSEVLHQALTRAVAEDPEFEVELRDRWQDLAPHLDARSRDMINNVSGPVSGNVVQARDVHGGISFGAPRTPEGSGPS